MKGTMSMCMDRKSSLEDNGGGGGVVGGGRQQYPAHSNSHHRHRSNLNLQQFTNESPSKSGGIMKTTQQLYPPTEFSRRGMMISCSTSTSTSITGGQGGKKIIQEGSVDSMQLLKKMALNYSLYCQTDLSAQISRLEEYLQESIAKLEEQQSLFEIKEIESNEWMEVILPQLVKQANLLHSTFSKRLDSLNELIVNIKILLDQLDKQLSLAEQKMGVNQQGTSSFRSVFKYFMKAESSANQSQSNFEAAEALKSWEAAKEQLLCEDPLNLSSFFKN